ncbi:MAG: hypothetical protein ACXAC7_01550 [Candidatus Hodarchaeales archaeon]|jgi:hypothetical protein
MNTELLNLNQLRSKVSESIRDYRNKLSTDAISQTNILSFVDNLIFDREMLIDELEEIKDLQKGWIPVMFQRGGNFKLLLNEIDERVYNDLSLLSYKLDLPPAKIINHLMEEVIKKFDGSSFPELSSQALVSLINKRKLKITISNHGILSLTGNDLCQLNSKVSFHNIDTLELLDMDIDIFMSYIHKISNCGLIRIPSSFSKLLVYAKCFKCDLFEFYDENS